MKIFHSFVLKKSAELMDTLIALARIPITALKTLSYDKNSYIKTLEANIDARDKEIKALDSLIESMTEMVDLQQDYRLNLPFDLLDINHRVKDTHGKIKKWRAENV